MQLHLSNLLSFCHVHRPVLMGRKVMRVRERREVTMHRSPQLTLVNFVITSSGTHLTHLMKRLAWPGFSLDTRLTSATRVAQTMFRKMEDTTCLIGLVIGWRNAGLSQIQDRTSIPLMFSYQHTSSKRGLSSATVVFVACPSGSPREETLLLSKMMMQHSLMRHFLSHRLVCLISSAGCCST